MKLLVRLVEAGLGLTFIVHFFLIFYDFIKNTAFWSNLQSIINYFPDLLGYNFARYFVEILLFIILIYCGRWLVSWASSNGGQTPNQNGN